MSSIDPNGDAYNRTYNSVVEFEYGGGDVILRAQVSAQVVSSGTLTAFTAQDAEDLLVALCQSYRDNFVPSTAPASTVSLTEEVRNDASAALT